VKRAIEDFKKGIVIENPTFVLLLGLCPTLAVSTSVTNGLGMGIAASFVLLGSNIIISTIRRLIPPKVRIPCFIVVIATFVTIVELSLKAYFPVLDRSLGIFVPLIVVNCIILGRAEAFASRNSLIHSILDAIGMGVGFTVALVIISAIREILGAGTICGIPFLANFEPAIIMILAPGALLTIGLLLGLFNWIAELKTQKSQLR